MRFSLRLYPHHAHPGVPCRFRNAEGALGTARVTSAPAATTPVVPTEHPDPGRDGLGVGKGRGRAGPTCSTEGLGAAGGAGSQQGAEEGPPWSRGSDTGWD